MSFRFCVPRRGDPGGANDVEAEVALVPDRRLTGVQTHANAHLLALGPGVGVEAALRVDCGGNRIAGSREREEEAVSLRVDLSSVAGDECLANDPPVLAGHLGVAVAQLLQQLGRAFDVREDEGDGPGRKRRAHPMSFDMNTAVSA
jgi:hypothetical protein